MEIKAAIAKAPHAPFAIESVRLEAPRPDEVLVSIPNAPRDRLDAVVQACAEAEVPCRFVRRRTETQTPLVEVAAE